MTRPGVTAILPTYNAEAFLPATLDALAAQTWPNLRVIAGDDASSDGTPEVLRRFADSRPGVTLVLRDANVGWMANTNDLGDRVETEYQFFMPHDDLIAPTYVERLVGALEADPGAVIAASDLVQAEPGAPDRTFTFDCLDGTGGPVSRAVRLMGRPTGWWLPHRGVARTAAARRVGGLKPNAEGDYSADFGWLFHMALLGRMIRVPEVLYRKVYRTANVSRSWSAPTNLPRLRRQQALREIADSDLPIGLKTALRAAVQMRRGRLALRRRLRLGS